MAIAAVTMGMIYPDFEGGYLNPGRDIDRTGKKRDVPVVSLKRHGVAGHLMSPFYYSAQYSS